MADTRVEVVTVPFSPSTARLCVLLRSLPVLIPGSALCSWGHLNILWMKGNSVSLLKIKISVLRLGVNSWGEHNLTKNVLMEVVRTKLHLLNKMNSNLLFPKMAPHYFTFFFFLKSLWDLFPSSDLPRRFPKGCYYCHLELPYVQYTENATKALDESKKTILYYYIIVLSKIKLPL